MFNSDSKTDKGIVGVQSGIYQSFWNESITVNLDQNVLMISEEIQ